MMQIIRKAQVQGVRNGDIKSQFRFIGQFLGIAAEEDTFQFFLY